MNPRASLACAVADATRWGLTHVLGRNGGHMPGALALKVDPQLVMHLSKGFSQALVVTGTNGKTTTTGLLADALAAGCGGAHVACNRAGNNMSSGIAAALIENRRETGALAALECDELYTAHVLPQLKPQALLLLNLFRDQLDRCGEIDHTQAVIAEALTSSPATTFVYNADDPLCSAIAEQVSNPCVAFGIDEATEVEKGRVSDSRFCARCNTSLDYDYVHYGQLGSWHCPECSWKRAPLAFAVRNLVLTPAGYSFAIEDRRNPSGVRTYGLTCRWNGLHMVYDVLGAFAAALVAKADPSCFQAVLDAFEPTAGRMKTFSIGGRSVSSNLAKNPAGFDRMIQQVLTEQGRLVVLYLNDRDADGHDVSWIWDVDFERLLEVPDLEQVFVGGTRANDLQVRLKYAGINATIVGSVAEALTACAHEESTLGVHVIANYTAFPPIIAELERLEKTEWQAGANSGSTTPRVAARASLEVQVDAGLSNIRPLRLVHLFPDALNLYGDGGNVASLERRCTWRGIPLEVHRILMGEKVDLSDADLVLLGGGSDRDQLAVAEALREQRDQVAAYIASNGVLLAICGGYQLLGDYYCMGDTRVEGLGVVGVATTSGSTRLIGNVAITSPICTDPIVGFENHAGRTHLHAGEKPLGSCLVNGTGNNGKDGGEGLLHRNVVGTYLHGPILPKNPGVTDWLIARALERRGLSSELPALDDTCEQAAHTVALGLIKR